MSVPDSFGDKLVWKNFDDVENAMDQAVKAGIRIIRTWGFRDLNVTTIPGGVSWEVFPVKSKLSASTAPSIRRGRCRFLYDLLPKLGEWCCDNK